MCGRPVADPSTCPCLWPSSRSDRYESGRSNIPDTVQSADVLVHGCFRSESPSLALAWRLVPAWPGLLMPGTAKTEHMGPMQLVLRMLATVPPMHLPGLILRICIILFSATAPGELAGLFSSRM